VRRCSRVAGDRKTELGYFACEKEAKLFAVKRQEKWWVAVRMVCSARVCWLFAKDVSSCRRLKIQGWSRQDEFVVSVAKRSEGGPVIGRVGVFTDGGSKGTKGGSKPCF